MNQPARNQQPTDRITGTIQNIRGPYGKRQDWYILTLEDGQTVTGNLPATLRMGDCCEFHGTPESNAKYGPQFKARSVVLSTPSGDKAVKAYLQKFDGIGPVMAARIVDAFGGDGALETLDKGSAEKLAQIRGVSKDKAEAIIGRYRTIRATREQDMLFAEAGITEKGMERLLLRFGRRSRVHEILKENPYKIVEADGIGFLKADAIAQRIGIEPENPYRIRTGLAYTLKEEERGGHTFLTRSELALAGKRILKVGRSNVEREISEAAATGLVVEERGRIYSEELYVAECRVAALLSEMTRRPFQIEMAGLAAGRFEALDPDQQTAFRTAASSRAMVITGGPGTGKTHTIRTIIEGVRSYRDGKRRRVLLAAPTGKAANRMKEATGEDAKTIHRLLVYDPQTDGFVHDERNPLEVDTLIVDEFSMVDIRLAADLLRAIPDEAQVLFVGDKDQLPSVGPGRVLADVIACRKIPVVHLTHLHRQGAGSGIDRAAKLINAGEMLPLDHIQTAGFVFPDVEDLVFHREDNPEKIPDLIARYSQRFVETGRFAAEDIMVLCPQKKGGIGGKALNPVLRDRIHNPGGAAIWNTGFRVNDRVIQLRNDYDLGIFNGDLGTIRTMAADSLLIDFDGGPDGTRRIRYPLDTIECLDLAYALTVHKSQGSEYPAVIMPVHEQNRYMLKRGLVYTGLTRGKRMVVVVGTEKALKKAVRTVDGGGRNSALAERIGRGTA